MSRKNTFKITYFIFAGILAVIMALCLFYVNSVLKEYEASQPKNVAVEQFKIMRKAAKDRKLKSLIQGYYDGELDDELIIAAEDKMISAEGELSARLTGNTNGGETLSYTVLAGDERVADVVLSGKNGETKLMLFTMTDWTVESMGPVTYTYDLTLPASMKVLMNDEVMTGTDMDGDGRMSYYIAQPLEEPTILIRDSIGAGLYYDGTNKLSITEYTVQIPSNYRITSANGLHTVPPETAETKAIDDYKYVAQYTPMPETATYRLGIIDPELTKTSSEFVIIDNLGNKVDYTFDGHTVKLEGQASLEEIPADVYSKDDVLAHARKWSLFMTADLGGTNHGYGQIEKFLLPDSYLMDVAYDWATGVDITFTSVHTLDNPPFSEESVSGYVKYSDTCFSVDVKLTKVMHLNSGDDVTDTMNSRFYYIQKDGVWYVADIQEIIG